jgi:two-component system OmpR family response regulator
LKIILIDDDVELLELLEEFLSFNGMEVTTCPSGKEGLAMIEKEIFDVAVLDVMMPGMSGLDVLKRISSDFSCLPVIMLTAKGEEIDRVVGIELGADDYMVKPFSSRELLARIKAIGRRKEKLTAIKEPEQVLETIASQEIELDEKKRHAIVRGETVELSAIEFDILNIFVMNRGIVLSRDKIMDLSRGKEFIAYDRSIDVTISRIRQKVEKDPREPELIKTVWGVGYIYTG